jgi:integrase
VKGRQRWITIGPHGSPWTPQTARKEAAALLVEALEGNDRIALRQVARKTVTFNKAADAFFTGYAQKLKPRTRKEYEGVVNLYLRPAFGTYRVDAITRGDVERAHGKWAARPSSANHAVAVLSKIMSWCELEGWRVTNSNPCRGIQPYRSTNRERFLQSAELSRLGKVLDDAEALGSENPYVLAAIRLLIYTGMRLNEALSLKWENIDAERRMIFLPDSKTGAKPVYLSQQALGVLQKLHRFEKNPHVFVGGRVGEHLVNLQKPWDRLRKLAKLEGVRLHDLRHTYASVAGANGASLPMIGGILGHKDSKTTSRYTHLATGLLQNVNDAASQVIADALKAGQKAT